MRFLTRSLVGVFLMSLTLGLLVLAGWTIRSAFEERANRDNRPREAQERVFSSNVVTVAPTRITPVLTAFGSVASRRTLQIRAPSAGRIVELAPGFVDGGSVDAGALLLRIDPANAQTALDLARTGLLEGQSELADADRALGLARDDLAAAEVQAALRTEALTRQRGLAERGFGTASEGEASALAASSAAQSVLSRRQALAQAEARLEQARNTLSRLEIALAEAERDLADTELHAGFSGALAEVTAVEGGLVTANEKLADLIDPDALDVSFRVSTAQFSRLIGADGRVQPAQVTVSLDVFGAEIVAQGRLTRASAAVGEGLTGRLVFAELDAAPGFRPGDFVTVQIAEPPLDGVALLPATAVDAGGTVLALDADDRLEQVATEVLRRQGDDVIVRVGGLAGREVVAERSPLLGAGIKVRPLRVDAPDAAAPVADLPDTIELTQERRAQLIAFVEGNDAMPAEAKARVLAQLSQDRVPLRVVQRIEERMGG